MSWAENGSTWLHQVEIQEAYQLLARTVDELVAKYGRGQ